MYAGVSAHICPQRGFVDVIAKGVIGKSIASVEEDGQALSMRCTCQQPML